MAHNNKNGVYHPEFLHHPGKKLDRLRHDVEFLTIYLCPAYPGLPGAPKNLYFLVLATPDLTDSIYNFVLGSSDGLLGWSWVHQHKKFRFPFIPVGDTEPLPMIELGRMHPSMRKFVLNMSSYTASELVPWPETFLSRLEEHNIVPHGTGVDWFLKQKEHRRSVASSGRGAQNNTSGSAGSRQEVVVDRVTEWLSRLDVENA